MAYDVINPRSPDLVSYPDPKVITSRSSSDVIHPQLRKFGSGYDTSPDPWHLRRSLDAVPRPYAIHVRSESEYESVTPQA